jgi:hypothetical protein
MPLTKRKKNINYSQKPYIPPIIIGILFIIAASVSIILTASGINVRGFTEWGYWLYIPGFGVAIFGGLFTYLNLKQSVDTVINSIKSYESITITELSDELNINQKDVKDIIIDAIAKGIIQGKIEAGTGRIVLKGFENKIEKQEKIEYKIEEKITDSKDLDDENEIKFCSNCRSAVNIKADYCPFCGEKQ